MSETGVVRCLACFTHRGVCSVGGRPVKGSNRDLLYGMFCGRDSSPSCFTFSVGSRHTWYTHYYNLKLLVAKFLVGS